MLGIRRYEGWAIDLWLGEKESFICDKVLKAAPLDEKTFALALADFLKQKLRHLAIWVDNKSTSKDTLMALKSALKRSSSQPNQARRITFCLGDDADLYESYRQELANTFEEGWGDI